MMAIEDGVLVDPLAYRAQALQQRFQTVHDGVVAFHGISPCADPTVPRWIVSHFPALTPTLSFFRQSPLGQVEPHLVHDDRSMGEWSAILYLTPEPPAADGTVFWYDRDTGAERSTATAHTAEWRAAALRWFDPACWAPAFRVAAQFNRIVLFPSERLHSRAMPENYGVGDDARLIQVCFGTGRLS
jgi:hypothetical protein